MRGKDACRGDGRGLEGITPAHAGKSGKVPFLFGFIGDHPRPCGEKLSRYTSLIPPTGSPPPMRGKDRRFCATKTPAGITPAHAGKRATGATTCSSWRDHPRPCGEKQGYNAGDYHGTGSPPPMRGKAHHGAQPDRRKGITPAHAGKRRAIHGRLFPAWDHPRPCGEKGDCAYC